MSALRRMYKPCRLVIKSPRQPLPFLSGVRHLSSAENISPYSCQQDEPKMPPWIKVPQLTENPHLLEMVQKDAALFRDAYQETTTDEFFEREVESFLGSRLLLIDLEVTDPLVKCIHLMNRKLIGHLPVYTTADRVLKRLGMLNPDHQNYFLEELASRRVLVFKKWTCKDKKLPPIECKFSDHGLLLAPQTGLDDSCSYKAESDASFNEKSKTATIASVIWKVEKMLDSHLNWGLPCKTSGEAEMLALLGVLNRGRELKIEKIDAVTDSKINCDVLNGKLEPTATPYPDLCMAVLQVAKQYKVFTCRWEPREMLGTVDRMARLRYPMHSAMVHVEEIMRLRASHWWGFPIFRINEVDNRKVMEALLANVDDKTITYPKDVFLRTEGSDEKFECLGGIVSVLQPPLVIVLVGSAENASRVQTVLKLYQCSVFDSSKFIEKPVASDLQVAQKRALILVDRSDFPMIEQKCLLIVFDSLKTPTSYSPGQENPDLITLRFLSKDEKTLNSKPVDPTLYGYFRDYDPYARQDKESYSIMTIDIRWREDQLRENLSAVGKQVESNKPDFICFQGVSPTIHWELLKHNWWKDYFCSEYYPDVSQMMTYTLQLSKLKPTFKRRQFSNSESEGDNLSIACIPFRKRKKISIAACHFDCNGQSMTADQGNEVFKMLVGCDNAIVCGEGLAAVALPTGWMDACHEVTLKGRFLCELAGFKVDSIATVGEEPVGILPTISAQKC